MTIGPYCIPGKCFSEYFGDGASIPANYVLMVSAPPSGDYVATEFGEWVLPPVDEMITRTCARIDTVTESKLRAGFTWGEKTFQNDQLSLLRINGACTEAFDAKATGNSTWSNEWITADNSTVTLAIDDMIAVGKAAAAHERDIIFKGNIHKTAVRNLETSEEVAAYDYTTGW